MDKEIFSEFVQTKEYEVDILVKVKIAGEERFVLIHIENQAKKQGGFGGRMFDYFAVVRAKFGLRIYPIAIFLYDSPKTAERHVYSETEFGMEVVRYQFQAIQLNRLNWQDYIGSSNPVAVALMAKMNVKPEDHATVRREFYTLFSTGKLSGKQLRIIDEFMKSYLKLTTEQYQQIRKEMVETMPAESKKQYTVVMEDFEIAAYERGIEQGVERGVAQGVHSLTLRLAERRFGTLNDALRQRISALPKDKVEEISLALFDFETQDELTRWLDANIDA